MHWPFQSIPKTSDSPETPRLRPSADWNGTENLLENYGLKCDARQFPAHAAQNGRDNRPAESDARFFRSALISQTVRYRFRSPPAAARGTRAECAIAILWASPPVRP